MTRVINLLAQTMVASTLFFSVPLLATPVTVQEVGMGQNEIVNISASNLGTFNAYAGVLRLLVDGIPTDGFCVDPWHWSSSAPQQYETVALGVAPKPPGPMGAETALKIEQLWQHFYTPSISNEAAAGLQIAIWELVDAAVLSASFSVNSGDYGSSSYISWVEANPSAAAADLVGLTGPGQDYAIQRVPDSGTPITLLGLSFLGLVALRKKLTAFSYLGKPRR